MKTAPVKTAPVKSAPVKSVQRKREPVTKAPSRTTSAAPGTSRPTRWVSFVGAGPGDPDLLTLRAVDLLREAEIVVTELPEHEALVRTLFGLPAPAEPEVDDSGADAGDDAVPAAPGPVFVDGGFGEDGQPLTHAARAKVVMRQARTGKRVVRLMAGDPFLYAAGPEEAQACTKAGIGFEIVPGVSSVSAVPAYAGIPLTTKNHRELTVVSCAGAPIDWSQYAQSTTLVLLSAVGGIGEIARELVAVMRRDVRTDWTVRDDVRAKLRSSIKRLLVKYKYPPDKQPAAIKLVMDQMEAMAPRYANERAR